MSRNPAMNPSAEWSLSFFDWSFLWGLIADYKFWAWPLQWILFVSFFPEYTIKKIYIICTYGATNVTKSIFFFRQSSQYWKKNQMNSHTPNNLLPLCFYYFYRCHSYCWANWSAREPSKKLLQEVLTTCKKTWGQISGKEIFYCTVNQLFSNYFIKMSLPGNQSHIQQAQME